MIQALSEAGLAFETAANIIGATPVIADTPTRIVDVTYPLSGVRSLLASDPGGGWLPSDIVPAHVWERQVLQCRRVNDPNPSLGDLIELPPDAFVQNERGTMIIDRSAYSRSTIEVVPLTGEPVYAGEIDPLGLYAPGNARSEAIPHVDEHLLIVNGRWVFSKTPEPIGDVPSRKVTFDLDPLSVIEPDRKTVRVIGWGRDEAEQDRARYHLKNFESLLDVNVTLAIRKMKRRAYGLRVDA